jgi:orotate phosphoribosyltransferase
MTNNPTVTQADRDAAADWVQGQYGCQGLTARALDGTAYGALPKAFAAHRKAAYAQAIDDAVAVAKRNHDYDTQDQIAALKENRRG